ncbi:MAG: phosphoribosylanthranilate isomerase [bacterium]
MPLPPGMTPSSRLLEREGALRIKVCCIGSVEEAAIALDVGADALGLVSAMPSGPGVIADEVIASIIAWVGQRAATVLLTSRDSADGISEQVRDVRPTVLQLVDAVPESEVAALRERLPDIALMPVVHVRDEQSVADAAQLDARADGILLDSGNPAAAVKELGGTGRVHDWVVSRAIRDAVRAPVFLAGGLRPDNVARAIRTVRPFGVDVCSGVRRDGRLDRRLLTAFVAEARAVT